MKRMTRRTMTRSSGRVTERRRGWLIAAASALMMVVVACAPGGEEPTLDPEPPDEAAEDAEDTDAPTEPGDGDTVVRVGFISPTTGFVASLGTDMQRGWGMYWDQHGTDVDGVTVEWEFEDDAGDPDVALTKARRLVEEVGVDIVAGPILANTAYAVADYVTAQGLPSLHITGADDLTQRDYNPLVLRVGQTSSQSNYPAGEWAAAQGYETAVTVCPDYAFGWESCGGFVSAFVDAGGEITEQLWPPLGSQDFSTYVTQIRDADPDVVFIGSPGDTDAILFHRAWHDFGLDMPLIGNCCYADSIFLRDVGEEAVGQLGFSWWAEGRDADVVRTFVADYEERYGEIPSLYAAGSYMMAEIVAESLRATGGDVDGEAFIEAARGVSLDDSLFGPLTFDDYNNAVGPVFLTRVELREDGTMWNVVDETIPNVSQFWNLDADDYLQQPPFSREFTGQ